MTIERATDFATRLGVTQSYITKLKQAGRLVLADDGKSIDVEKSLDLIAATADPNRDDVAARHAAARGKSVTTGKKSPIQQPDEETFGHSYAAARAVKEKYAAMAAKMEYERAIGKLGEISDFSAAIEDILIAVRQSLEQFPNNVAPMLVGGTLDEIRAKLKQAIIELLDKATKDLSASLQKIAHPEE